MLKKYCFHIMCLIVIVGCGQSTEEITGYAPYQVESGIVKYEVTGSQTGNVFLYFDSWGQREAKYTQTISQLKETKAKEINNLVLINKEFIYEINLDNKQGIKIKNDEFEILFGDSAGRSKSKKFEDVFKSKGGKKIGKEKVLGRKCHIWYFPDLQTKIWAWKSITLKMQMVENNQNLLISAVHLQENVPVPEEKLTLPPNLDILDAQDMMAMTEGIDGF